MKLNFSVAIIETEKKKKRPHQHFGEKFWRQNALGIGGLALFMLICKSASKIKRNNKTVPNLLILTHFNERMGITLSIRASLPPCAFSFPPSRRLVGSLL